MTDVVRITQADLMKIGRDTVEHFRKQMCRQVSDCAPAAPDLIKQAEEAFAAMKLKEQDP
jgi:hypothetical protein